MDNQGKGTRNFIIYCCLVGLSLFLFFTNDRISFLNRYTQLPLSFWQGITASTSDRFSETFNALGELADFKKELEEAQEKIRSLEQVQAGSVIFQAELLRLKEQMSFFTQNQYTTIPAQIIAKEPFGTTGVFTINKGENDGVGLEYPVIAYQDGRHALVGKVFATAPSSSRIIPINNVNNKISARLLNSRYEGLITGQGISEDLLRMDYLPKEALRTLKIGETVVTSGLSGTYPEGLLIGTIKRLENNEHVPYLTAYIEPAIQKLRLEYVFVQKPQILCLLDREQETLQENLSP